MIQHKAVYQVAGIQQIQVLHFRTCRNFFFWDSFGLGLFEPTDVDTSISPCFIGEETDTGKWDR